MTDIILTLKDNITIRTWRDGDEKDLASHANNRKIWQNLTDRFPHPYKPEDSQRWIKYSNDKANWLSTISPADVGLSESKEAFDARCAQSAVAAHYAICHFDKPIGGCGLDYDLRFPRTVNHGYWISEEYWGKGIATQVVTTFSQWVFDTFPWIVRVEADPYSWNEGSQNVLRKSGFEFEGVQKLKAFKGDKYGDVVTFGKIRPRFEPVPLTAREH